jgi:hypothetical protein
MKLGEMRRVERLVAEHAIDREELAWFEVLCVSSMYVSTAFDNNNNNNTRTLASSKSVRDETAVVCVRRMFFCASAN